LSDLSKDNKNASGAYTDDSLEGATSGERMAMTSKDYTGALDLSGEGLKNMLSPKIKAFRASLDRETTRISIFGR
jgi:hypothetical protein